MKTNVNLEDVQALLAANDVDALKEMISTWQPSDVAEIISEVPEEDQLPLFNSLPYELAAEVFDYCEISVQKNFLQTFSKEQLADILNKMSPDDRTALFEELPSPEVTQLLVLLSPKERTVALSLLGYPEYSVGRLMTPDYLAVKPHWAITQVLTYIRKHGKNSETLNVIYVVDDKGFFLDDIRVRELLLASPDAQVSDIMDNSYVALNAMDDQEVAVSIFSKHNRVALPVIDSHGYLVGIVTIDDILDVAQEEDTEDIQKLGGMEALEEPYLDIPILGMFKKRAGWLVILFMGELLTATAMEHFENEIKRAVILTLFIPLIISSGGNTGSQAATLIIRAIALGEVSLRDWWRVMRREILSGLLLGLVLGLMGFGRIAVGSVFSDLYGPHWLGIAFTVSLSLIGVVLWGTLTGSMFPLILRRLGLDPATSSAPFVATLVDVTGLIIYFSIAMMILKGTLL